MNELDVAAFIGNDEMGSVFDIIDTMFVWYYSIA
jgi:hypothetical protein